MSKYENKFAKLQKKAGEFNLRSQLKNVKKKEFTMDEEEPGVSEFGGDMSVFRARNNKEIYNEYHHCHACERNIFLFAISGACKYGRMKKS